MRKWWIINCQRCRGPLKRCCRPLVSKRKTHAISHVVYDPVPIRRTFSSESTIIETCQGSMPFLGSRMFTCWPLQRVSCKGGKMVRIWASWGTWQENEAAEGSLEPFGPLLRSLTLKKQNSVIPSNNVELTLNWKQCCVLAVHTKRNQPSVSLFGTPCHSSVL